MFVDKLLHMNTVNITSDGYHVPFRVNIVSIEFGRKSSVHLKSFGKMTPRPLGVLMTNLNIFLRRRSRLSVLRPILRREILHCVVSIYREHCLFSLHRGH